MKTKNLLIGAGVLTLGILAYKHFNKKSSTSTYASADGKFANASGTGKLAPFPGRCPACRTVSGGTYVPPQGYNCDFSAGDRCISNR